MADLTLYTSVPSRGMVVRWLLEELGEPYAVQCLDLAKQEHKTPDFLAINPMGRVPALVHGEHVVTETAAICTYLAEAFPAAGLNVNVDDPARADYLRWIFFSVASAEPSILWHGLGEITTAVDYRPFADITDVVATLREHLAHREYVVADRFTAADVVLGASLFWGIHLIGAVPPEVELTNYWDRLATRPAWQRAQAADQALVAD